MATPSCKSRWGPRKGCRRNGSVPFNFFVVFVGFVDNTMTAGDRRLRDGRHRRGGAPGTHPHEDDDGVHLRGARPPRARAPQGGRSPRTPSTVRRALRSSRRSRPVKAAASRARSHRARHSANRRRGSVKAAASRQHGPSTSTGSSCSRWFRRSGGRRGRAVSPAAGGTCVQFAAPVPRRGHPEAGARGAAILSNPPCPGGRADCPPAGPARPGRPAPWYSGGGPRRPATRQEFIDGARGSPRFGTAPTSSPKTPRRSAAVREGGFGRARRRLRPRAVRLRPRVRVRVRRVASATNGSAALSRGPGAASRPRSKARRRGGTGRSSRSYRGTAAARRRPAAGSNHYPAEREENDAVV